MTVVSPNETWHSFLCGMGYKSRRVRLFNFLQLTKNPRQSIFFGVNIMSTAHSVRAGSSTSSKSIFSISIRRNFRTMVLVWSGAKWTGSEAGSNSVLSPALLIQPNCSFQTTENCLSMCKSWSRFLEYNSKMLNFKCHSFASLCRSLNFTTLCRASFVYRSSAGL